MRTTIEYPPFLSFEHECLSENSFSLHIEAILSHFVVNSRQFDVQMYRASLENLCRKTNKARESVFYLLAVRNMHTAESRRECPRECPPRGKRALRKTKKCIEMGLQRERRKNDGKSPKKTQIDSESQQDHSTSHLCCNSKRKVTSLASKRPLNTVTSGMCRHYGTCMSYEKN